MHGQPHIRFLRICFPGCPPYLPHCLCFHGFVPFCHCNMDALPANRSWQPSRSHGTYQHEAITSSSRQLLMGTWLPETCWTTIRRENKEYKKWHLVGFFFIHAELRCTVNHTSDFSEFVFHVVLLTSLTAYIFMGLCHSVIVFRSHDEV